MKSQIFIFWNGFLKIKHLILLEKQQSHDYDIKVTNSWPTFPFVLASVQKNTAEPNYPVMLPQEEAGFHVNVMWQPFHANGGCQSLQPQAGNPGLLTFLIPRNPSHSYWICVNYTFYYMWRQWWECVKSVKVGKKLLEDLSVYSRHIHFLPYPLLISTGTQTCPKAPRRT